MRANRPGHEPLQTISEQSEQGGVWCRLGAVALVLAALGLPINDLFRYALLVLAAVPVFAGTVSRQPGRWLAALAAVEIVLVLQMIWPAPRIDEGHNVFIIDGADGGALQRGLPEGAYRLMAAEFDARYPPDRRCDPKIGGCWRGRPFPDRAYAFSGDGLYDGPEFSRCGSHIDFSDPVWARLGFINDLNYNWFGTSDIQRNRRERGLGSALHPWQLTMPYFVMYRFPAAFEGSRLCWRGEMLWPGTDGKFTPWRHTEFACRPIERSDVGRMIFGVSIATPLAISLEPTPSIQLRRLFEAGLGVLGLAAVLLLLVRYNRRQLTLPFVLIGLTLVVVFLNDASFIGGVRPFDGGDDGLFYEGMGRRIAQYVQAGDFARALEGGEKVFYYGGPGLRYFRALELFVFGDSFYGYLSVMLLLPFVVFAAFGRFFSRRAALGLTLVFIAIPIGAVFGTTLFQYVKWAARGFADPAAATAFLAGFVCLLGRTGFGARPGFGPGLGAGLLFALALFLRPNLAPAAGMLLGGAGLAALWEGDRRRVAGLCLGFLPVLGMALHNYVFGGVFVLFSANATIAAALPMPPTAYVAVLGELLHFDFAGEHVRRGLLQWARWLAGPSESFIMIPLHAAAVAVLLRVAFSRRFDPWLRLTAWATIAQHTVAWFYLSYDRYYHLTWFLTLLVCAVWLRDEGLPAARRRWPGAMDRLDHSPPAARLQRILKGYAVLTGGRPAPTPR